MKFLTIIWQRLVDETGQTCALCRTTYEEIQKALELLKKALSPLAIEVSFEKREIDQTAFANDPSQSNKVWICGRPLEEWLGAQVGQSPCCDICGDAECRTIEVDAKVYEFIPAELIIKAGLIAASQLYGEILSGKYSQKDNEVQQNISSCCCSDSTSDNCC
ncbi:MAG: DUF2703 domain-containing protein [Asgard group archaeon]|nr:DUF2703 domain-containing protein [Asgard group archaeon]